MGVNSALWFILKWLLFPGINLHARLRYRIIAANIGRPAPQETRWVLDAGCGNGMLSYQAYLKGNHVIAVSIKDEEIRRNREFFNSWLKIPEEKLRFLVYNLYEIEKLGHKFDEIICCEVLEHIRDDRSVCEAFYEILKPGGVLHLCCPNAEHPDNKNHHLDPDELGGHVRPGYTESQYKSLLEPIGFRVSPAIGVGGSLRQRLNRSLLKTEEKLGLVPAVLFFLATAPLLIFEERNPSLPYSIYVCAHKPA